MRKICLIIAIILLPLMITGCWDQVIVDKTGYILIYGMELAPQNNIMSTYAYPIIGTTEKDQTEIITVTSVNSREAREKARKEASLSIAGGKTQELLYSEEIAKMGLHSLMEVFERDPTNPSLAYVVVVDGSPKELINAINTVKQRTSLTSYVSQLLDQNISSSQIPETRVYKFDIDYYADGIDPITPLIKLDGDRVLVVGSALFSNDKMVGKIDTNQNVLLEAMMGKMKPAEFVFKDKALVDNAEKEEDTFIKQGLSMLLSKAEPKISIKISDGIPNVNISLKFTGNISEYMWDDVTTADNEKKLEKILSKEIENKCNELVKYFQEVGSDPIGIGNMIRIQYNDYWKNIDWSKVYKSSKINVKASVKYMLNGTIK